MNLSVLCVLLAAVSGCAWGLEENSKTQPAAAHSEAESTQDATDGNPARDKRWYLRHYGVPYPGPVQTAVAIPVPVPVSEPRFYDNYHRRDFSVHQSNVGPSLRSRAPAAAPSRYDDTYDSRYGSRGHPAFNQQASYQELVQHRRRQEQQYYHQTQQFRNQRFPDVVDTVGPPRIYH